MSSATSRRRRRGNTTLEFALIGSAFLFLLLAIFDVGRYFAVLQSLNAAMTAAARAAVVGSLSAGGSCPGGGVTLPSSITGAVPLLDAAQLCISVTSANVSGQTQLTVAAQYPFSFVLPAWTTLGVTTLNGSTTVTY